MERALTFIDHIADSSPELWSGGCLLGAFALELAETNARMQKAVSGLFQAVTDNFAGMLEPLIAHTEAKDGLTAHELADQLLGTLEGSIVLPRHTVTLAHSQSHPRVSSGGDEPQRASRLASLFFSD